MRSLLRIHDLSKTYIQDGRTTHALQDVSFDIYRGEIFLLLGPNGAGKTTLSSIISTVHPPTSGEIMWEGSSIYKDICAYRRELGYCPQMANLDDLLTVEENLLFAGRYHLMPSTLIQKRIVDLTERFGLGPYSYAPISVLSGGYRQRVLLARALISDPQLIILDEPTTGLDPHVRKSLWEQIRTLKEEGKTVIVTTHYLEEAEELADRVCILERGRVRLIDTPARLMKKYKEEKLEDVFLQLVSEE